MHSQQSFKVRISESDPSRWYSPGQVFQVQQEQVRVKGHISSIHVFVVASGLEVGECILPADCEVLQ